MTFLHPALLWLLPLAAVPIVLHLLTLHRLRTVELSTFRFLFDSYVQQRRRMKFLEALLAMLRTLFLLFVVLMICRPVVKHWSALFGSGTNRDVVMLVDCSASMNAVTEGVSAFARAKSAALTIAQRLGSEDRLTLVRVASKPEEVFSRFSSDAEAIRNNIEALETSSSRANIFVALAQVLGPLAERGGNPIVYLFTDGQASGWRELENQGLAGLVPEGARFIVVDVGSREPVANRAVVGDVPRPHRAIRGLPVILRARVVNHSQTESAEVPVSVFVDEKEIARTTLALKPGESGVRELVYVPAEPGMLRGRFEIPADRFPDDDTFLFTLSVSPQVRVLLVNGKPSKDPLADEALYLRTALTASSQEGEGESELEALGPGKDFVRSLDVQEIPEGNVNPQTLQDVSVVILANCGGLKPEQYGWVRDFVFSGGGLIVFPGDRVNPDHYNKQFFPVPGPQGERLTAVQFAAAEGDPKKADTFERFASIDFGHPVLSVFDDPVARYLSTARLYRRFALSIPEERGSSWPLIEFSKGGSALVESRYGDGIVLVAAFPANTQWGNLPLKPEFVPLVLRMVSHVERGGALEAPSVVPADGLAEIAVAKNWGPVSGKVTGVTGRARALTFKPSGNRLVGGFGDTGEKGYYTVEVKGGRTEQPKQGSAVFAVNLSPGESRFEAVDENQVRALLPAAELTVVDASAEAQQLQGSIGDEREIWRPLTLILFVIIGIEFMLATLGGQKTEAEEGLTVSERIRQMTPGTLVGRMTGAQRVDGQQDVSESVNESVRSES